METLKSKIGLCIAFVLFSGLYFYASPAYALTIEDNFDSYANNDPMNGVNGWVQIVGGGSPISWKASNDRNFSSPNSLTGNGTNPSILVQDFATSTYAGYVTSQMYGTDQNAGLYLFASGEVDSDSSAGSFSFNFSTGGNTITVGGGTSCTWSTVDIDDSPHWSQVELHWSYNGSTYTLRPVVEGVDLGEQTGCTPTVAPFVALGYYMNFNTGNNYSFDDFRFLSDADYEDYTNVTTRIVSFSPADMSTTSSPVTFDLHAYVNADDLSTLSGIRVRLHNIDQNFLLFFGALFGDDIYLLDHDIDTAGDYFFSTTTPLEHGNYRIEACIDRTYLFGWIINNFSPINDCQSHQFIVGSSTFLGNLSQNGFTEFNDFVEGLNATSTEALSRTCNPLNAFDIRQCALYLLVPSGDALNTIMTSLKEGILTRFPWGYPTRLVVILTGQNVASLPTFTVYIPTGNSEDENASTSLAFDPSDMLLGGASIIAGIEDPRHGQTARDIFEPLVLLMVALAVIFTIASDVMGSHKHAQESGGGKNKLS